MKMCIRDRVNIDVDLKLDEFVLTHVICEDLGIALGKAAKEYIDRTDGARGFGDAVRIHSLDFFTKLNTVIILSLIHI